MARDELSGKKALCMEARVCRVARHQNMGACHDYRHLKTNSSDPFKTEFGRGQWIQLFMATSLYFIFCYSFNILFKDSFLFQSRMPFCMCGRWQDILRNYVYNLIGVSSMVMAVCRVWWEARRER